MMKMELAGGVKTDWNKLDEWQRNANQYTVTLKYKGRQLTTEFFTGIGWDREPNWKDVLSSLLMDKQCYDSSRDLTDFCNELGYDPETKQAKRIYQACKRTSERLERLLGDDLEDFEKLLEQY